MKEPDTLLLGCGMVARHVAQRIGRETKIYATTRDPQRIFELASAGIEPVVMPWPQPTIIEPIARGSNVLVSFPPDGATDQAIAPACKNARSIVYISSTGVYGQQTGHIDDQTPVQAADATAVSRLAAEETWRAVGATVLRAPGIYGPDSGLHVRLKNGTYSIPGDGTRTISRIHVDDLASFVLAVFANNLTRETYVIGDKHPTSHLEVVKWLCTAMNLPIPASVPLEEVAATLRGNRAVDSSRALRELGISLKYPSYKEGYKACLDAQKSDTVEAN